VKVLKPCNSTDGLPQDSVFNNVFNQIIAVLFSFKGILLRNWSYKMTHENNISINNAF